MYERITALLGGWSLYWWTGVFMDRTFGQTVNGPEQVQLSSYIRLVTCLSVLCFVYSFVYLCCIFSGTSSDRQLTTDDVYGR